MRIWAWVGLMECWTSTECTSTAPTTWTFITFVYTSWAETLFDFQGAKGNISGHKGAEKQPVEIQTLTRHPGRPRLFRVSGAKTAVQGLNFESILDPDFSDDGGSEKHPGYRPVMSDRLRTMLFHWRRSMHLGPYKIKKHVGDIMALVSEALSR